MSENRAIENIEFHSSTTSPSDGIIYDVKSDASLLNIDYMGTGTFTSIIEGKALPDSEWDEIMALNTKTYDMSTRPSTFDTWQLDIKAWSYIRVKLTSVSDEVSVLGKAVG